jgi:glycosyltransferase involved in cell wall biosynthesis
MRSEVSVIVPCYNHAHYLFFALQSVQAQSFSDWEIIVVDDGSSDNTQAVVNAFADPRISYIYQENQGLSAARNAGIRAARGAFLAFLDADDEWLPSFMRRCVEALRLEQKLDGVYTCSYFIDAEGLPLPQEGSHSFAEPDFRHRIVEGGIFPLHAAVVRASSIRRIGLFDTLLTSLEDWDLWIRISAMGHMKGIPEYLACYRVYPGSMSTNVARMHANRLSVLAKHFGPPDEEPGAWSEEKRRAYGFAYRTTALSYIQQGDSDKGWQLLKQSVSVYPSILGRLDTFYELVCGDQPRGYRGQAHLLDLEKNAGEVARNLENLLCEASPSVRAQQRKAYGNLYLAVTMLSDQTGHWSKARRYVVRAIRANPRLGISPSVLRRSLKLLLGQRLVGYVRVWGISKDAALARNQPARREQA